MHFCEVAARVYGRLSKPRNTSLNWFIPALVKSSVGSSPGTTGLDGTMAWPFDSKKDRNDWRMSEAFMRGSILGDGTIEALKWLALALMVLDHVNTFLYQRSLPGAF